MRCIKIVCACRAVGLGLLLGALACGGKAEDDPRAAEPSYTAPRANPSSPPVSSPPVASATQPPQSVPPMNPPPRQPPGMRERPPVDLARAAAENVLMSNCGPCHGPSLTPAQAQDGINYINDIDKLVVNGLILPLNSADSRIIVLMRNGIEPPPSSGYPRMTDADIAVVADYIDNPRFWPILVPAPLEDAGTPTPTGDAGADGG